MSVVSCIAIIQCDACGQSFKVLLDNAKRASCFDSVFEIIEDTVRGGETYFTHGEKVTLGSCSVQDGKMLCEPCTVAADERNPEA